ncbi:MAG: protein kinase [Dolichospermum circinale Clear-D4]|nr:protein kinase [Dolichospermum circinale Clear-D4]
MTWTVGKKLQNGKYIIQQVLGQGGFGITYQALQVNLNRSVVIKTPNKYLQNDPEYKKYIEKFIAEGQLLARLSKDSHPHIVGVIELFQESNIYCLVMEFISGENLFQIVKHKGALPEAEIISYIRQIGEALIKVHEAGLVHRDAHPGNIMIKDNGKAVLIDFGIAKQIIPATQSSTDKSAHERFAPYEQRYRGSRDPRVDIYCLAASLYYGVTGQSPINSLARKLDDELLIAPQEIIVNISNELNEAILKGMALEAKDRPESMQLWLEMLTYKSQISNAEQTSINTELIIVSELKNINNVEKNIINVEENIINVEENIINVEAKNPTVTVPFLVEDSYEQEVIDDVINLHKQVPANKPIGNTFWIFLVSYLLFYGLIGYYLAATYSQFWIVAMVIVGAMAVAWWLAAWIVGGAVPLIRAILEAAPGARAVVGVVTKLWSVLSRAWPVYALVAVAVLVSIPLAVVIAVMLTVVVAVAVAVLVAGSYEDKLEEFLNEFHTFLILAGGLNIGLGLGFIVYQLLK